MAKLKKQYSDFCLSIDIWQAILALLSLGKTLASHLMNDMMSKARAPAQKNSESPRSRITNRTIFDH